MYNDSTLLDLVDPRNQLSFHYNYIMILLSHCGRELEFYSKKHNSDDGSLSSIDKTNTGRSLLLSVSIPHPYPKRWHVLTRQHEKQR
jgi:hypothetical protein